MSGRLKKHFQQALVISALSGLLAACGGDSDQTGNTTEAEDITEMVQEAYVFGFPAVSHYKLASLSFLSGGGETPNVFSHHRTLGSPSDTLVVSPNNDTVASVAMLDLRAEPVVITIPEVTDRYFSIQLLNVMTHNLPIIASEQEGAEAGSIIVAGPDWDETGFDNVDDLQIIYSDASLLAAFARIEVLSSDDLPTANNLQDQMTIETLSTHFSLPSTDPVPALTWPDTFDVKTNDSADFFSYMNFMLQFQTFSEEEESLLADWSRIGVMPGEDFQLSDFTAAEQAQIEEGISMARSAIQFPTPGERREGWSVPNPLVGNYGDNYLFRAIVAWYGLYAFSPEEVAYISARFDENDAQLNGSSNNYMITFAADEIPPADYFWSLSIYDQRQAFIENEIDRYSIGDRSDFLVYNDDGSLTIYLQDENPGDALESNWLPIPSGPFSASLRLYGPDSSVITGEYRVPGIVRNNP